MITAFLNIGALEMMIIGLIFFPFVIAFFKCATNKNLKSLEKGVWLLVIWSLPLLGAVAYLVNYGWGKKREMI